jgi:ParB-like chromosome segregation protein Spo0J
MSHDTWQLLPELTVEEYQGLKADIAAQGVLVPLVIDADTGEVIEGHHRLKAWTELRAEGVMVPPYPREVRRFASDTERVGFVIASNLFRRHLNRAQRAEVVARLRTEGWSLRRIGEVVGVDVATAFRDLAGVADATPAGDEPATVTGRDDKRYPAHRPRPAPTIFVGSPRDAARAAKAL